jgi:hypothetical protein
MGAESYRVTDLEKEEADLLQHRTLVTVARHFVLMRRIKDSKVCTLADESIESRVAQEIIKHTLLYSSLLCFDILANLKVIEMIADGMPHRKSPHHRY